MKYRIMLVLTLLSIGVSAEAQTTQVKNCSYIEGWLINDDAIWSAIGPTITRETQTFHVDCRTTGETTTYPIQTNVLYFTMAPNPSATATGSFTTSGTGHLVVCDPTFNEYAYDPIYYGASRTGANSYRITAVTKVAMPGAPPGGVTQTGWCNAVSSEVNTTYCPSMACHVNTGSSPIVVDVGGKGFVLTDVNDGVMFDISGSGTPVKMGWTATGAQNAFLALPGLDELVHSGKELFGNFTPQPYSDRQNGFDALRVYDTNQDGVIDARDPVFKSLRLWLDENHDGISQAEELHTLPELGVNSISLKYHPEPWRDQYGNAFRYRAKLNPEHPDQDGKWTYDVFFVSLCK